MIMGYDESLQQNYDEIMAAHYRLFRDAADETCAKIDFAAKRGIPLPMALGMDNRDMAAAVSPWDYGPETVRYFAMNPLAAAAFPEPRDVQSVENVFSLHRKAEASLRESIADMNRRSLQTLVTGLDAAVAPGIHSREFLRLAAVVPSQQDAADFAAVDKYHRMMQFVAFQLRNNPGFLEAKDDYEADYLQNLLADFSSRTGVYTGDVDVRQDLMKASALDWARAVDGFTLMRLGRAAGDVARRAAAGPRLGASASGQYPLEDFRRTREAWAETWDAMRGETLFKTVGDGLLQMIPYMTEFVATGGMAAAGRSLTAAGLSRLGIARGNGLFSRMFRHLLTTVGQETARTGIAYLPKVALDAAGDSTAGVLKQDQNGDFYFDFTPEQRIAIGDALVKAFASNFTENLSETIIGESVAMIPRAVRDRLLDQTAALFVRTALPEKVLDVARKLARGTRAFTSAAAWNGPAGELAEELLVPVMNWGLTGAGRLLDIEGLKKIDQESPLMAPGEFAATALTVSAASALFALPGLVVNLGSIHRGRRRIRDARELYEALPEVKSIEETRNLLRTARTAAGQAEEAAIVVPAKEAALLFQTEPEVVNELGGESFRNRLEERVAGDGDLELDLDTLLVVCKKFGRDELMRNLTDLALNKPGGVQVAGIDMQAAAREFAADEKGVAELEQIMAEEEQIHMKAAAARRVMQRQAEELLRREAARIGGELAAAGRTRQAIRADVALITTLARNIAAAGNGKRTAAELIQPLSIRFMQYRDFAAAQEKAEPVPFQSLPVKPGSITEFLAMPGHRRPPRVNFADTAALYRYFEEHFVNGHITTPEGFHLEVRPGHFYSFIAGKRNGKSKGFIARASSADEALRMIREGAVSFEEISGLESDRMRNLPTYTDVLTDPDFSYRDGDKITYGKKYDDLHDADGFLAVTLQIDGELLHPVSFHPRKFSEVLKGKNLKWYVGTGAVEPGSAPLPKGKSSASTISDIDSIIPQNGPDVKGEKEKKNYKGAFAPGNNVIYLFESADRSTFAHEVIHYFQALLDQLHADGMLEGQLREDYDTLSAYGTNPDGTFNPEKLPKAFERYLMTGRAPNRPLAAVFARFRQWLTDIYRALEGYFQEAPPAPEILEIFDRWTAGGDQTDLALSDNEALAAHRAAGIAGLGGADRKLLLEPARKLRDRIWDELEKARVNGRADAGRTARSEAAKMMKTMRVYRLHAYLGERGKLDGTAVRRVYGKEILDDLRRKGVIGKVPRPPRPGERFHDPQHRRDISAEGRRYRESYDNFLHDQHPIVWLIRANRYGAVKPSASFGIHPEQFGSYLSDKGIPSDVAARELSHLAGYEISESELIDALADVRNGDLLHEFHAAYRADRAYFDRQAEQTLRLESLSILEQAATDMDYRSADEMIDDLRRNPAPREFVRNMVKTAVERFENTFPASECAFAAEAMLEKNEILIRALQTRFSPEAARIGRAEFREAARKRIAAMSVRDALRSDLFTGAIRRNARKCADALRRGDWQTALEAALRFHANSEVLRRMHGVRNEIDTIRRRVKRRAKPPKASGRYQVAGDLHFFYRQLADRYGLTADSLKQLQVPEKSLEQICAEYGMEPGPLPEPRDYRELTVEEFFQLSDTLESIRKLGRELVSDAENSRFVRLEHHRKSMLDSLRALPDASQNRINASWNEKLRHRLAGSTGSLHNLMTFCRMLDGGVNALGQGTSGNCERIVFDQLSNMTDHETEIRRQLYEKMTPHFRYLLQRLRKMPERLRDLPAFPENARRLRMAGWTPETALMCALNRGNAGNWKKLLDGYGWNDAQGETILRIFDRAEDWQAIQGIWDALDSLYPDLDRAYYEWTYHHLFREPASAFTVTLADGTRRTVAGGYFPIAYDGYLSCGRFGADSAEMSVGDHKHRTSVAAGMTKERKHFTGLPVDLTFGGLVRHLEEATHFCAFKTGARDLMAILDDSEVQRELKAKLGGYYPHFRRLVENAVNPVKPDYGFLSRVRSAAVAMGLWGNLKTVAKQFSTFASGVEAAGGWQYYLPAVTRFYTNTTAALQEVNRRSPFMQDRSRGKDRDIRAEWKLIEQSGLNRGLETFREVGFQGIKAADAAVAYPVWMAKYQFSLDQGMTASDARLAADKLIEATQGSGRALALSGVQLDRNFLMMFAGPAVALWNRNLLALRHAGQHGWTKAAEALLYGAVVPAVTAYAVNAVFAGSLADLWGDDEKKQEKALLRLLAEGAATAVMGIPLLRDFADVPFGSGYAAGRTPLTSALEPFFQGMNDIRQGKWSDAALGIVETTAAWYGLPIPTVWKRLHRTLRNYTETD